jgi:nucleotide-binding universal stress UspA family protein
MRVTKVLCAVDFSEPSREALHFAADLARQYDAELTLIHVYTIPGYTFPEGVMVAGPEVMNDLLQEIDRSLESWKQDAIARAVKTVRTVSIQGSAAPEIVRFAEDRGVDLIVVGTHGRGGLAHVLLGSVAEKVVRKAPCPVLTVRASDHRLEDASAP